MEPLDPELRRLVHEAMVQAVPDQAREDRVLLGLLARLPQGGPPGGGGGGEAGPPTTPGTAGGTAAAAGKAGIAAASKTWLWVVLGATTVAGGFVLGAPREPGPPRIVTPHDARVPAAGATRAERASETVPGPATTPMAPSGEPAPATTDAKGVGAPPERPSATGGARTRSGPSPRSASAKGNDRTPDDSTPVTPAAASDELAAEIQQIAAADRALARGEARRALQLAREHATQHPHGQLGLEREAIELGARCQLAEPGAAQAAAAFLREHADAPAAAKVRTRCLATK